MERLVAVLAELARDEPIGHACVSLAIGRGVLALEEGRAEAAVALLTSARDIQERIPCVHDPKASASRPRATEFTTAV